MKFTIGWLKEHLDTKSKDREILEKLTDVGLEVESFEKTTTALDNFRVAKIINAEQHPNADKLKVCDVDIGKTNTLKVVCGAPNAKKDLLTVYAAPGSVIPKNKMKLTVSKIRGVTSYGMLCSESELNLSAESEGIIELNPNKYSNNIGKNFRVKFSLHLKVDTGMSRLGFDYDQFVQQFEKIKNCENISIKGLYSHLSSADEKNALDAKSSAQLQKKKFKELLKSIDIKSNQPIKVHIANSAGMLLGEDFHFDMVRIGLSIYGYKPSFYSEEKLPLKPSLSLKVKVAFIRNIEKGVGVSYGNKFISSRKTKLAILSIGYADGILRNLSGKIKVMHNKQFYQQVGSITMDQMMVDITDSTDIKIGSTMILLGSDGEKTMSPVDWAKEANTIPWEILCSFKNRLPKVQVD